jgi:Dynamin GTPase effector domain
MELNRSFSLTEDEHCREFERLKPEVLRGLSIESNSNSSPIEVNIICNVYTYFHLASRRIIETIPMICEIAFAQGLGEKMRKDLTKMLGIIGKDGNKNSENFMQDEQGIRDKKRELNKRKRTVERSLNVLDTARAQLRALEVGDEDIQL